MCTKYCDWLVVELSFVEQRVIITQIFTSFPPTDLVRMTAEETGGGIQATVCNLKIVNNNTLYISHCMYREVRATLYYSYPESVNIVTHNFKCYKNMKVFSVCERPCGGYR